MLRSLARIAEKMLAGTDIEMAILLRGTGKTSIVGSKRMDFDSAAALVKERFNEGKKLLVLVQGLGAGSNMFAIEKDAARAYKVDIAYIGVTSRDALAQASGRINDLGKTRAQGGNFYQIVDIYDRSVTDAESADLKPL
jgi:hypothetical protein